MSLKIELFAITCCIASVAHTYHTAKLWALIQTSSTTREVNDLEAKVCCNNCIEREAIELKNQTSQHHLSNENYQTTKIVLIECTSPCRS